MSDFLNIEINGKPLQVKPGTMVIEAADEAGFVIPRFCYHKKLSIAANCRMCLVDVEKAPKPVPACATPVTEGMKVHTKSAKAIDAQKSVMEFLLINHPLDCPICDQGGECELQDLAMGFGKDVSRFKESKRVVREKNIGPLIATDMTRCIHCTRCVRFGREIAGVMELGATGRGEHMAIETYMAQAVSSEMSGNVIDLCPVGALTSKPYRYTGRPWENTALDSIAPHDCVGSNLELDVRRNHVMRVLPRENDSINEVWIADRDRFSYTGLYSTDRLQQPMIKQGESWREVDWETALGYATEGLQRVIAANGADQLGALVSASSTLEELFLLQKLLRGLGSNNIDHRLQQVDFSDQAIAPVFPYLGQAIANLETSQATLLIGSHTRKDQPLIAHRLRKSTKRGAKISMINCIDYDANFRLAENIVVHPYAMPAQLAAVAKVLAELSGKVVPAELQTSVSSAVVTAAHRQVAQQLHDASTATVLLGMQAMAQPNFSALRALANCIAELANAQLGYLPQGSNSAGAWLAGCVPHRGPANAKVTAGKHALQMMSEGMKALLLFNVEPELDCADAALALQQVDAADFVIAFSPYITETMRRYADVLLPITPFTETSGTYVNVEGRWQSFAGNVTPLAEARPGWKVLRVMGNFLKVPGFDYVTSEEVRDAVDAMTDKISISARSELTSIKPNADKPKVLRIGYLPMYSVDMLVRRAQALQQTQDAAHDMLAINRATAEKLGLLNKPTARVKQGTTSVSLPIYIEEAVPDDCVFIPQGTPANRSLGLSYASVDVQAE
jgi:NADH-quinone oxidoreductase subunit G